MTRRVKGAPGKAKATRGCRHHWIIEGHSGPTSRGVCKLCGAVNVFSNYVGYSPQGDDRRPESKDIRDNDSMKARSGS